MDGLYCKQAALSSMLQAIKPWYLRTIRENGMDKAFVTVLEQNILGNLPLKEMGPLCWKITFSIGIKSQMSLRLSTNNKQHAYFSNIWQRGG